MTHRVIYSRTARDDLNWIGAYIESAAGAATAELFIRRLIAKAESLRFMPARYRVRSELQSGLRAVAVDKYLLFYRVSDDVVSIVRVLHGARDITDEMFPD